ncbi:Inherit from KOG: Kinesin family member [Seminavis robusta]|uniref:Inherit from KOG: Kinesin family member n=1 Tax=Seminavis robusta TaxID=568900 RepID=A0A9N8DP46_9STRA|nr:Inherit from KOG: Kinesin family member [Seminavis robusta]|eukprot:Sro247_g098190.1 Inherit from KOG: Kinesin family member (3315) ;mRNA; f:72118-82344
MAILAARNAVTTNRTVPVGDLEAKYQQLLAEKEELRASLKTKEQDWQRERENLVKNSFANLQAKFLKVKEENDGLRALLGNQHQEALEEETVADQSHFPPRPNFISASMAQKAQAQQGRTFPPPKLHQCEHGRIRVQEAAFPTSAQLHQCKHGRKGGQKEAVPTSTKLISASMAKEAGMDTATRWLLLGSLVMSTLQWLSCSSQQEHCIQEVAFTSCGRLSRYEQAFVPPPMPNFISASMAKEAKAQQGRIFPPHKLHQCSMQNGQAFPPHPTSSVQAWQKRRPERSNFPPPPNFISASMAKEAGMDTSTAVAAPGGIGDVNTAMAILAARNRSIASKKSPGAFAAGSPDQPKSVGFVPPTMPNFISASMAKDTEMQKRTSFPPPPNFISASMAEAEAKKQLFPPPPNFISASMAEEEAKKKNFPPPPNFISASMAKEAGFDTEGDVMVAAHAGAGDAGNVNRTMPIIAARNRGTASSTVPIGDLSAKFQQLLAEKEELMASLETKEHNWQRERENLIKNSFANLQEKLYQTQQELDDALQARGSLEATVRDAELLVKALEQKAVQLESRQRRLGGGEADSRVTSYDQDLQRLQAENDTLQKRVAILETSEDSDSESKEDDDGGLLNQLADATEQIVSLRDGLAQSEEQQLVLAQEKEAWDAERDQLEKRLDEVLEQLVDATEQVADLKEEKDQFRWQQQVAMEAKQKAERSRRASITMITSLEATLARKEADMDNSQATKMNENQELQKKVEDLENTLAQAQAQLEASQEQVESLRATNQEDSLSGLASMSREATGELTKLQAELEGVKSEYASVLNDVNKQKEERKHMQEEIEALQKVNSRLLNDLEAADKESEDALQTMQAALEAVKSDKSKIVDDLEKSVTKKGEEIRKLQTQLESLQQEKRGEQEMLRLAATAREGELQTLRADKGELVQQLQAELDEVKATANNHKEERQKLQEEINALQKVNTRLLNDLEATDKENEDALQTMQAALENVKSDKSRLAGDLEAALAEKGEEIRKLRIQLEALQREKRGEQEMLRLVATAKAGELETLRSDSGAMVQKLQAELDGVKAEYTNLLNDVNKQKQERENLQEEMNALQKVNTRLLNDLETADKESEDALQAMQAALENVKNDKSKIVGDLEASVANKGEEIRKFKLQLEALQRERKEEQDILRFAATAREGEVQTLRADKGGLAQKLQAELDGVKAEYTTLLGDVNKQKQEREDLQEEIEGLQRVNTRLLNDLETTDKESEDALQTMQAALESVKSDKTRLVGDLEASLAEKGEEVKKLQLQLEALQRDKQGEQEMLRFASTAKEEELRTLKSELVSLRQTSKDLEALCTAKDDDLHKVQSASEALLADLEKVTDAQEALEAENVRLNTELDTKVSEQKRLEMSVESLERSLKKAESTVQTLQENASAAEESKKETETSRSLGFESTGWNLFGGTGSSTTSTSKEPDLGKVKEELNAVTSEKESLNAALIESEKKRETLESSFKESGETIATLQDTISMLESAGEDMLQAFEEEKHMLVEQIEAKTLEVAEMQAKARSSSLQVSDKLTAAVAEKEALSETLESVRRELDEAKAAKTVLESSLRESSTTVENLRETIAMLETAGEDMLRAVEEDKQTLVEEMEAKFKERLEEAADEATTSISSEKKALEMTVKIIRQELQEASVGRGKAEASLKESETTIATLRESISMLESAGEEVLKAVEEEKEALVGQVATLEAALTESQAAMAEVNKKLAELASEKNSLESELNNARDALQETCGSLEASKVTIHTLREAVSALKENTQGSQTALLEERDDLAKKLAIMQSNNGTAENLAELSEKLAAAIADKEASGEKLEATALLMNEFQLMAEENRVLLEDATSKLDAAKNENEALTTKVEALQGEKHAMVSNLLKSTEECQRVAAAKASLEKALVDASLELEALKEASVESENKQAKTPPTAATDNPTRIMPMAAGQRNYVFSKDFSAANTELTEKNNELKSKVAFCEAALVECKGKLATAEGRLNDMVTESYQLEASADDARQQSRDALEEKVESLEAALRECEGKLELAESQLTAQAAESRDIGTCTDDGHQELQAENEKLGARLRAAEGEKDDLRLQVKELMESIQAIMAGGNDAQDTAEKDELAAKTDTLAKEVGSLKATLKELEGKLAESQMREMTAKNQEQEAAKEEKQKLEAMLRAAEGEKHDLQLQVKELMESLQSIMASNMQQETETASESNAALEERVRHLEDALSKSSSGKSENSAALEGKVRGLEEALSKSEEDLEICQKRLVEITEEGIEVTKSNDSDEQREQLLSKLSDAEAEADDLREEVEELVSRSKELESLGEEEDVLLREQVETMNAWNLALEARADRSNKELENARTELEALKSSRRTLEEALKQSKESPQGKVTRAVDFDSPSDENAMASLRKEKKVLTLKFEALEESYAEKNSKVLELEARVEDFLNKSTDLKLRLARKTALITELQEDMEEQAGSKGAQNNVQNETEEALSNLRKENKALVAKLEKLEETHEEKKSKVSELEARVEESINKSADLKLRLARKTSMITELEEDLEGYKSNQPKDDGATRAVTFKTEESTNATEKGTQEVLNNLHKDYKALVSKVERLEDAFAEKNSRVSELEAREEEYLNKSADLKLRLARKTAMISELEEDLEAYRSNQPSGEVASRSVAFKQDESLKEEHQAVLNSLRKEVKELVSKLEQLEDVLAERNNKVSELEARVEDDLNKSADLKLRLARKTAHIAELEEDLEAYTSKQSNDGGPPSQAAVLRLETAVRVLTDELAKAEATIERQAAALTASGNHDQVARSLGDTSVQTKDIETENRALSEDLSKANTTIRQQRTKLEALEESLAEKSSKLSEQEARLEEHIGRSSDLKLRLARKTAKISELEDLIAESGDGSDPVVSNGVNPANPAVDTASLEELEQENQLLTVKVLRLEGNLKQEKDNLRKQQSKVEALEDTIVDKGVKIAEVQARLEEYIGTSADLKLRLARRTATIAELQEELDEQSSGGSGKDSANAAFRNKDLPFFDETSHNLPEGGDEVLPAARMPLAPPHRSLPDCGEEEVEVSPGHRSLVVDATAQSTTLAEEEDESPFGNGTKKQRSPSQQLKDCLEDAKASESLFEQIASLAAHAEKKKRRLKVLNERLEKAVGRNRISPKSDVAAAAAAAAAGERPVSGLAQEQDHLQKTVAHLENQWKETRSQLDSVHKMNLKLEAALDHISRERASAIDARSNLEASLREAQEEVRSLRVAVDAMEAERTVGGTISRAINIEPGPSGDVEVEVSEHPDMDPERTTFPLRYGDV